MGDMDFFRFLDVLEDCYWCDFCILADLGSVYCMTFSCFCFNKPHK